MNTLYHGDDLIATKRRAGLVINFNQGFST